MDTKETYNLIAEDWHKDHQSDDWWVEGTNTFISFLKPGGVVLDGGCGGGTKSQYLVENGLEVVGIDFSKKMVEIAKKEVPEATFFVHDFRDVSSINQEFDGIFAQASFLHIPKTEAPGTVAGMADKLKADGCFHIAVKEKWVNGVEEEVKAEDDYGYSYKRFFSYYTVEEIESCIKNAGLEIVYSDIKPSGKTRWIQVIGRKKKSAEYY